MKHAPIIPHGPPAGKNPVAAKRRKKTGKRGPGVLFLANAFDQCAPFV